MSLVAAAIMPHGFPLIPALDNGLEDIAALRAEMVRVGRQFAEANVDTIVLVGPHGTRVDGAMAIVRTGRAAGALRYRDAMVEMNVPVDHEFVDEIANAWEAADVPVALVGFGGNRMDQATMPMDWGAMGPLWFLGHDQDRAGYGDVLAGHPEGPEGPPVVLITPSRKLDRSMQIAFGRTLGKLFAESGRRIGFVASCDWAHVHRADGPYGAHPIARQMDDTILAAIRSNDLRSLQYLPQPDVEAAAIDGMWQCLILAGIQEIIPMRPEAPVYGIDGYYSMIVSRFLPE
ncbi:MAG: aromatic ring-opening dioxygenase subunit LigB [Thermomicrobiales bacterium]|nr:aromatic ring-opening dioxygenase subunit LigB [Thermomicrobiales bacterium]